MHLLIAAAGSGRRMGADGNKLLLPVAGRPVLAWTLQATFSCEAIHWVGIVGQPEDREAIEAILATVQQSVPPGQAPAPTVRWIEGGQTRQQSVCRGLAALPADAEGVLIHDGARCLVGADLLRRCVEALQGAMVEGAGVIAATRVTDTIKQVDARGTIENTPDRQGLWAAQTPQGFPVDLLRRAHDHATARGWSVTDDAALFERMGIPVRVLEAPASNIKLTTPFDLIVAEAILGSVAGAHGAHG